MSETIEAVSVRKSIPGGSSWMEDQIRNVSGITIIGVNNSPIRLKGPMVVKQAFIAGLIEIEATGDVAKTCGYESKSSMSDEPTRTTMSKGQRMFVSSTRICDIS